MTDDRSLLVVDAHVHIYDCFDLAVFLKSAYSNCRLAARHGGAASNYVPLLFLTEGRNESWFQRLKTFADNRKVISGEGDARYAVSRTEEDVSLLIKAADGRPMFLISGRQIVTQERLEVLSLGSGRNLPEGSPLEATVNAVIDHGGIPVIPWGFGKWHGNRGRILEDFLSGYRDPSGLFLGDNGGRPAFLPPPSHFQIGHRKGIRILPGSDPLPFPSESSRPGAFGCTVPGWIRRERPGEDSMKILLNPATVVSPFGPPETPFRFMRNQIAMQLRKYRDRNPSRG